MGAAVLQSLSIRNIVLIEALDLEFESGLNVLTGETGAGKSILLDALGFALGRRDAKGLTREGAAQGSVSATLAAPPDHPARAVAADLGLSWDEDGLTLRRVASADGPSRAFVNDQRVSAEALRSIGETLVEVHGQHDDRGLLNPRGHRALLDAFAGDQAAVDRCRDAWRAAREAHAALAEAEARLEEASRDRDYLEHAVKELAALAPEVGEDEALDARRRLMQAAERIREDVARALAGLGPEGAVGAADEAMRRLAAAAPDAEGRLEEPIETLSRALDALGDAEAGVERALSEMEFDEAELERTEERLFAIRALARKHGCGPDELPGLATGMTAQLEQIEGGDAEIGALRSAAEASDAAYRSAAQALTEVRVAAAKALDKEVAAELPPLRMERARFATSVGPADRPGPEGVDQVAFLIATNPGAAPGPLEQIASGGELSRFLLALKVSLAGRGAGGAMIFDEIDRGVGGATADAVGRRLARLADAGQILVVTHSPQVAARGDVHFLIEKTAGQDATRTDVIRLADGARRDEIARMLAGDHVTDAARAAADELIG